MNSNKEGRVLLAIQAVRQGQIESMKLTAATYEIPYSTLCRRLNSIASRRNSIPNNRRLTPQEESAIVQFILDLDSRGFSPRASEVQEMANLFFTERQQYTLYHRQISLFNLMSSF